MKIGYGEIIKKSVSAAKKNKWLWIYGVILAAGSSSYNTSRSISSQDFQSVQGSLPQLAGELGKVFTTWVSQLNSSQIAAFFGSLSLVVIFSIIIKFVLDSWAEGALIHGVERALEEKEANLVNTSPTGLRYFKKIIALKLIAIGMGFLSVLALLIPTAILVGLSVVAKVPLVSVLVGLLALIAFIFLIVCLAGATLYGARLIVLKNYPAWNAWKDGFKTTKKFILKTVLAGVISGVIAGVVSFVGILVSLLVLGLPVFLLVAPLFEGKVAFSVLPILPAVLFVLVFVWFNSALTGAVTTFKYAVWNQVFEKIWKKE